MSNITEPDRFNLSDYILGNSSSSSNTIYTDFYTNETINFNQLKGLIRQINANFQRIGLAKGDCVCISSPNDIYLPPIILGTIAAGGAITPANPLFTTQELQKQLTLSKSKYIIAHPSSMNTVLQAAKLCGIPQENIWSITENSAVPHWKETLLSRDEQLDPISISLEESKLLPAYICFSSGTTGPPKGVVLSHYNLISVTEKLIQCFSLSPKFFIHQKILGAIPLFHIFGVISFILVPIPLQWHVIILSQYSLETACQAIEKHKINSYRCVPPMLLHLINNPSVVNKYDLSSLKIILVGAAPISPSLCEKVKEKYQADVLQGYGLTETSGVLTVQTAETYVSGSVGRLLGSVQSKVIDHDGKELKTGETGEILIKSSIVTTKYLDNPVATSEAIDTDGYFHTGDIGYVDKLGNWYILDRAKELIKFNAYQIAPAELESILLECPLVSDVAVIGIYDEKRATEVPRAYICLSHRTDQSISDIKEEIHLFLNSKVIHYKRLRGGIAFIDAIPKSASGKILRKNLKQLYMLEKKSKL